MPNPRRWVVWPLLALLTVLVIASCGLFAFTRCHPSERVEIVLKHVPPDTDFLSTAATTDDEPRELEWVPKYHFGQPILQYPPHYSMDRVIADSAADGYRFSVLWRSGERYGVVMQNTKGEWRAAWFTAAEVPVQGRNWLGGEGRVEFDLSKAEIVPLDADTVRALGLQFVKPPQ